MRVKVDHFTEKYIRILNLSRTSEISSKAYQLSSPILHSHALLTLLSVYYCSQSGFVTWAGRRTGSFGSHIVGSVKLGCLRLVWEQPESFVLIMTCTPTGIPFACRHGAVRQHFTEMWVESGQGWEDSGDRQKLPTAENRNVVLLWCSLWFSLVGWS